MRKIAQIQMIDCRVRVRLLGCAVAALMAGAAAVVAQIPSGGDLWNRGAAGGEYQEVLEVSGRAELGLFAGVAASRASAKRPRSSAKGCS